MPNLFLWVSLSQWMLFPSVWSLAAWRAVCAAAILLTIIKINLPEADLTCLKCCCFSWNLNVKLTRVWWLSSARSCQQGPLAVRMSDGLTNVEWFSPSPGTSNPARVTCIPDMQRRGTCAIASLNNIGAGKWRKQCFPPVTEWIYLWIPENADQRQEVLI